MHNFFSLKPAYPVNYVPQANTFSGQVVVSLWETVAKVASLYPGLVAAQNSLWETARVYTQRNGLAYTAFPTVSSGKITPSLVWLSPSSTGPIKKTTNYIKEI